ncbi:MAG TPA: Sec-independent protein translocase protein TatB [Acidimicrobiales bacterium]
MFNVGGGELLVIFLVALIVLGPQRLPDAARTVGKVVGEVRKISSGFQRELRDAFDDAEAAKPPATRRQQVVSLSSAVADVDRRAEDEGDDDDAEAGGADPATVEPLDLDDGEVAPEVGAALDQIAATPTAAPLAALEPPDDAPVAELEPADERRHPGDPGDPGDHPGPHRAAS